MYKYNIILSNSDQNQDKELHLLNTMLGKQVDGIIFMSGNLTEEHVEELKKSPVPIVLAASIESTNQIPSVTIDYEQAAYDAVKSLIDNGHSKIAFLAGTLEEPINHAQKLKGYERALTDKSNRRSGFLYRGRRLHIRFRY